MRKRSPYVATGLMISSTTLAHMRNVAYKEVDYDSKKISEVVEISIIEKNLEKHNRKKERNIRNANK